MGDKGGREEWKSGPMNRGFGSLQGLLDSFPKLKNAELKEFVRDSGIRERDHPADDPLAEVFALTRKLLSKTAGILNFRLLKDDNLLGSALEKVHPKLPFSIRLILWRKRFIRFMLDHRERLIP